MSNLGLEYALNGLHLDLLRTAVGDRYVTEKLKEKQLVLGGETSGHIVNTRLSTTGDGIIAALQVLQTMLRTGRSLDELSAGLEKFPQIKRDIKLTSPVNMNRLNQLQEKVRVIEGKLGRHGRVVIRPSGTEPLIRIMLESDQSQQMEALIEELARDVEKTLA